MFEELQDDPRLPDEPDMGFFLAWLDALRSGAFDQTQRKLSDGDRYCCLGVACEITPNVDRTKEEGTYYYFSDEAYHNSIKIPHDVRLEMGFPQSLQKYLIRLNDFGYSFVEIANVVEEELDTFWRQQ